MKFVSCVCVAMLAIGITTVSAKVRRPSDTDVLQAACYPDVQRLCKDAIPNEDKITACMEEKKASISKECTDAYEATQAD